MEHDTPTDLIRDPMNQLPTERAAGHSPAPPSPGAPRPGELPLVTLKDPLYGAERLERIGGGGFGEVWRVRYLGSEEAWKYIPIRPGSSERTGREAIHARRVDHQNVVRVLDVLKLSDHFVLRMDLIRGRDFSRVVNEDGVIPPDDVVAYGVQVTSALAHAHRQGIAHLDLKPHNLILTADGAKVMVTDFGISASLARDWGDPPEAAGTPFFMAPEQFNQPSAVGSWIDIWSLAVTLYWSMSLSYPFKFDGREPRDVIHSDPPIPLSEVAPYVPPALSRLIEWMLEKDPPRRPAGMDEVLGKLEAMRASPGDPEARAGDRAFALCLFEEAVGHYEKAARRTGEAAEAARAARLLDVVRDAWSEHDAFLRRIEARLAADDLAGSLLTLGHARLRFSRSAKLKELRQKVEAELSNRFSNPRRSIERELRKCRFAEARRYLDLLNALLGIPGGRKLLRAAGGEESVIDTLAVQRLRESVDRRENHLHQLGGAVEKAVQEIDFARARDALEELQNYSPVPENLERMRTFASAAEALAFLGEYSPAFLAKIASGEARPSADRPFLLAKAEARANELLQAFSPAAYPRFKQIEDQARAISETIQALRARVGPEVEAIAEAQQRGDIARVRSGLERVGEVVFHSDVISKDIQDVVRDMQKQLHVMGERAERLYREGQKSLERRQFNKAITELEEALRLGAGSHLDVESLIQSSSESAEKRRRLAADLHELDLAINSRAACPSDVAIYLEKAQELLVLQEEPKQAETIAHSASILTSVVEVATREIVQAPSETWLNPLRELGLVTARVKQDFVSLVVHGAADLPEKLSALMGAVLDRTRAPKLGADLEAASAPVTPESLEACLGSLRTLVEALCALGPLLLAVTPVADGGHPLLAAVDAIEDFAKSCARAQGRFGDSLATQAADLLTRLAGLVGAPVDSEILEARSGILEVLRRRRIAAGVKALLSRAARLTAPLAAALVFAAAVVLVWFAGERKATSQALDTALHLARQDPRWASVEGLGVARGEDLALALRVIGNDLPAFGALDGIEDPDTRFWARCVAGAALFNWIAPEGTPVLGRITIRRAVETTLHTDLNAAVQAWIEEAAGPFPRLSPDPEKGLPALLVRLEVADRVLKALRMAGGEPEHGSPFPVRERVTALGGIGRSLREFLDSAPRLVLDLREPGKESRERAVTGFREEYLSRREAAPSDGWRRLLDCETAIALARELRENPPWKVTGLPGLDGPAAFEILRLVAIVRERSGPLPVNPAWSEENDPLFTALFPAIE